MTTAQTVSNERLDQMVAGLDGVTPGPWKLYEVGNRPYLCPATEDGASLLTITREDDIEFAAIDENADARHFARCDPETMRSILTELLSLRNAQSEAVAVKALEWSKSHMPSWNGDWHTTSPFIYSVRCADENGWKWSSHGGCGYAPTPESAKAAAQTDYEQRIRSALTHPASPLAVTDEMVEAAAEALWTPTCDAVLRSTSHSKLRLALTAALEAKQ